MDRPALRLIAALLGLLGAASLVWMFQGLGGGNRAFILQLRRTKLAGLVVVGAATGIATVLFQTAAANRVLTPSIMGFDALYVLLQTGLVAALGVAGFAALPAAPTFLAEVAAMSLLAAGLFGTLLGQGARDIPRMILTGVILGVMFRALSGFLARVMDPNAFATVQAASIAARCRAMRPLLISRYPARRSRAAVAFNVALTAGRSEMVNDGPRSSGSTEAADR